MSVNSYEKLSVTCSCGNHFETRSTLGKPELRIELCPKCHPFYTKTQKVIDTAKRIKQFQDRFGDFMGDASA